MGFADLMFLSLVLVFVFSSRGARQDVRRGQKKTRKTSILAVLLFFQKTGVIKLHIHP
jgi:hypothetical protein